MLHGIPELPAQTDEAHKAMTKEQREVRLREASRIKLYNRQNMGDKVQFFEDMETAKRLAAHESFVCPMNMDWRGRVYSLPHFSFQRNDYVRAMFLFATGAPIGERGIYWLKVHTANCGAFEKIDKKTIEERVQWADKNIDLLKDYVRSPLENTGWTKADKPFLFLAACRELVSALAEGGSRVCHLPVSFDGSCSGLQHLSGMTRAPEGRYVNLVATNGGPEDIYQRVADLVHESITADTEYPELRKQCLDFGVTRSLVKRNVMVFAYSSKVYGMSLQHLEDTMEPLRLKVLKKELEVHPFGEDEGYAASKYLARHVHAAIIRLVRLPAEAMGFMQTLARVLAHEGKPLRWVTPAGLPWINRYHEVETTRIKLWLDDHGVKTRYDVKLATGTSSTIAKDKAANGVSPNFVHACDASHLLLTVNASVAEGITDIATVHDSFGCLPCHADRFNAIIREQFLKMYTDHDVLAELLASAKADLTEASHHKLPELPAKGSLNLEEILSAKYAFA
jgi:DNA-directed RNA polymerase